MPIVTEDQLPVRYSTWAEWRADRADREVPVEMVERTPVKSAHHGAEFCAMCWGQGRILEPARNGEGLVPVACWSCAGSGTA